nr:hypothetical protein [uncultured Pedobacter sp.]
MIPTKKGYGIELWGTYDDLRSLYNILQEFLAQKDSSHNKWDTIIYSLMYDIRKAFEKKGLKARNSHYSMEGIRHYGCQVTWVSIIFVLAAIRRNSQYLEINKLERSVLLQLEYWVQRAMEEYDSVGAQKLKYFLDDLIYKENPFLLQFMMFIDRDFIVLGGGPQGFRLLPDLLNKACINHPQYELLYKELIDLAKSKNCSIDDLVANQSDDQIFEF